MKAIAAVAIAGLIAATSLTAAVTPADAGGNHWKYGHSGYNQWKYQQWRGPRYQKNYYYYSNGWNPGAALATGAILGFAFGALATPNYYYAPRAYAYGPPPPYPNYYAYGPTNAQHVSYCKSKYRSYNVKYNTWIGYDGLVHQCVSPYD
jgi:BA14K-like protein